MVSDDLDGAIVSSHYFLFGIDEAKMDRRFLGNFIRTLAFHEQVAAQGSTNYAAIRPGHVLGYTIPLPPLAEQRRLVERIDILAAKIEEAKRLRAEADEGIEALCRSILRSDPTGGITPTPMRELVTQRDSDVTVRSEETYHFAGVYCFGRGVFVGQRKTGMEFQYPKLTSLRTDDFVYPKLMAWEGALATVPPECNGLVVSTEFPVFEVNKDKVLPEVLDVHFRTPEVWPKLAGTSTGTNMRRRRLNPADFLRYQFPLPSMATQQRVKAIREKAGTTSGIRATQLKELEAMFPAILDRVFRGEL
jgi:type I restriction enzyme, S subunit